MRPVFGVEKLVRIEIAHFAGNLHRKFHGVEAGNTPDPAPGISETVPECTAAVAERRNAPEATNNNAAGTDISGLRKGHGEIIQL